MLFEHTTVPKSPGIHQPEKQLEQILRKLNPLLKLCDFIIAGMFSLQIFLIGFNVIWFRIMFKVSNYIA